MLAETAHQHNTWVLQTHLTVLLEKQINAMLNMDKGHVRQILLTLLGVVCS